MLKETMIGKRLLKLGMAGDADRDEELVEAECKLSPWPGAPIPDSVGLERTFYTPSTVKYPRGVSGNNADGIIFSSPNLGNPNPVRPGRRSEPLRLPR